MADYYTPTGWPGPGAAASSGALRAEFVAIGEGFKKLPDPATPNLPVVTNGVGMETKSVEQFKALMGLPSEIFSVSATVNAENLTLKLSPTTVTFRSATLSLGATVDRSVLAELSMVVPSGATLGTANATKATLAILAIDNSGDVELAVANISSRAIAESGVIDTTTVSTSADSATVNYSITGRTGVPFRVVGIVEITESTAGAWSTAPSLVQGAGGSNFFFGNGPTLQSPTINTPAIISPTITATKEKRVALSGTSIDLTTGNYFTKTISGSTTFSISNVPEDTVVAAFILELTNAGSAVITWWPNVKWELGTAPTLTASGRDMVAFYTHDNGTRWNGLVVGRDMK